MGPLHLRNGVGSAFSSTFCAIVVFSSRNVKEFLSDISGVDPTSTEMG